MLYQTHSFYPFHGKTEPANSTFLKQHMLTTPKLSTMVVLHKYGLMLDTDKLLHQLPINAKLIKVEKRGVLRRGESKRDKIKRRNPKPITSSGFGNNSVTVVVMDDGSGTLPLKEIYCQDLS